MTSDEEKAYEDALNGSDWKVPTYSERVLRARVAELEADLCTTTTTASRIWQCSAEKAEARLRATRDRLNFMVTMGRLRTDEPLPGWAGPRIVEICERSFEDDEPVCVPSVSEAEAKTSGDRGESGPADESCATTTPARGPEEAGIYQDGEHVLVGKRRPMKLPEDGQRPSGASAADIPVGPPLSLEENEDLAQRVPYDPEARRAKAEPWRANTVELPISVNADEVITCLYCRRETFCEYALTVLRQGETAIVGVHAICLEPLRRRNPRQQRTPEAVPCHCGCPGCQKGFHGKHCAEVPRTNEPVTMPVEDALRKLAGDRGKFSRREADLLFMAARLIDTANHVGAAYAEGQRTDHERSPVEDEPSIFDQEIAYLRGQGPDPFGQRTGQPLSGAELAAKYGFKPHGRSREEALAWFAKGPPIPEDGILAGPARTALDFKVGDPVEANVMGQVSRVGTMWPPDSRPVTPDDKLLVNVYGHGEQWYRPDQLRPMVEAHRDPRTTHAVPDPWAWMCQDCGQELDQSDKSTHPEKCPKQRTGERG